MICKLLPSDFDSILKVVNDAAQAFKGVIPDDRWKEPYMSAAELKKEIEILRLGGRQYFIWIDGCSICQRYYVD